MSWKRNIVFCVIVSFSLMVFCGCTDPPGDSTNNQNTSDQSNNPSAGLNLVKKTMNVNIQLPQTAFLDLADLTAKSALDGEFAVDSGGLSSISTFAGGPQLVTVHGPDGDIVLMGWIDPDGGPTTISARTTAQVLIYFDTGGWLLPEELRSQLLSAAESATSLDALEAAIVTALSSSPGTLAGGATVLDPARTQNVMSFTKSKKRNAVLVDPPTPKSGITLLQPGLNSIVIRNDYRRRAMAYVDRVDPPAQLKTVALSPTLGATSLFGTISDLGIKYLYDANRTAYAGVDSDPIELPIVPDDAQTTEYMVTVIGAGLFPEEVNLSAERSDDEKILISKTLIIDFLVPLVANTLLPIKGDAIDNYFKFTDANTVISTFITTLGNTAPSLWDKAYMGDMHGALEDAFNAIVTDGTVRAAFFQICADAVLNSGELLDYDKFVDRAQSFVKVIGAVDSILTGFDSSVQSANLASSARAVVWKVTVNRSRVKLLPQVGEILKGETLTFTASVPDAKDDGPAIEYHWSTSGAHGHLADSFDHEGSEFVSSLAEVDYVSDGITTGDDTVTVEAFEIAGSNRVAIGKVNPPVRVTVRELRPSIIPRKVSLKKGETQTFTVSVPAELQQSGDELRYIWSTSGQFGGFTSGGNFFETTNSAESWTVRSSAQGSDTVTAKVFRIRGSDHAELGSATADILIEDKKTVLAGSWRIDVTPAGDANRSCVNANAYVSKVEGAKSYTLHGYNFFDPLFWGSHIDVPLAPGVKGVTDLGSEWRFLISGGCGPDSGIEQGQADLESRFAGLVIEITVKY